jgi:RNA polymerase sigma factor (sigma-70 family)
MKSDAELLVAAQTDSRPFRELYERYAERIYAFQLRRCGDHHAAYDLTAETFARAWISRKRFRDDAAGLAGPWLFAIARHVLLESVRNRRLERAALTRLGLRERLEAEPATTIPDDSWLDGLDDAFAELSEAEQAALRLRIGADLDYADVAAELGTTPEAARVRVHRGLTSLRTRLIRPTETTP